MNYHLLANALLSARPDGLTHKGTPKASRTSLEQWEEDIITVADQLQSNPEFDYAGFLQSCGLNPNHVIFQEIKEG